MAASTPRNAKHERLYKAIGDFFARHGLAPTPANYALIYLLMTDETSPAAQAVLALTSDGIRLTQRDADRILAEQGIEAGMVLEPGDPEALAQARRQIEDFSTIVDQTQAETVSFGRDLARGAAELRSVGPDDPAVAGLVRITGQMVERTRAAEAQLEAARMEAETLREKLAEAEEEARSDPLTRLPNRRAFEDRLAELQESGTPTSLAICDIDRFKAINDTHGHGVGDRVLRLVADVLQSTCTGHMVARIGGEEFVVLFENVQPGDAAEILDEARESLAVRHFKVRETDAPVGRITFSAGVALCAEDPEPPLKRADNLLYQAKNGGRNLVIAEAR